MQVEVAAVGVSVVAVLISSGALFYTRRADSRAEEHETRLKAQEARSQAQDERDTRREQREAAETLAKQQAYPRAEYLGAPASGDRVYRFRVINTGKEAASDLDAWLIDEKGNVVSEFSYESSRIPVLERDKSGGVALKVMDDVAVSGPLFVRFTWFDLSGSNERTSHVEFPT
jgi:hypothetical protein